MARIVKHTHTAPMEVKVGDESKWICMCGLSDNLPFCSGAHELCNGELEGMTYKYENGVRKEVEG